ncbi:hypothetical protein PLICRDRAFT_46311 [Plicaturopsis crispa FD-325 SS-3]|uniref:Protein phosphatase methylesterase 1 n=1 Tax=Plicaturopsis crispa FD-325 SS-3 TaxID=944288 RepID=A0A0C9SXH8_PLICR|nr:hypothetical protein PLICRDRAFT_46311 [Plicaturopsis crispa FD-325 SS-3]
MSARIAKLPHLPHVPADQEDEDGDEDSEAADSLGSLPGSGMGPPAMPAVTQRVREQKPPNPAFAPISASGFFADAFQVSVPSIELDARVYYTPPVVPPGRSPSSTSVMVCHHGAGSSALSFACFAREVTDLTKGECGVLAIDARRHGKTTSSGSDENLSIDILSSDLCALLGKLFPDPKASPTIVLVGHSMGGAVVVRACPLLLASGYKIVGVAVLDVVEGTAIEALPHMNSLLNARPDGFASVEDAVEWHLKTKAIHNPTSARISVPSIIVPSPSSHTRSTGINYIWRTPLRSTAPYWSEWFTNLSSLFLATRTARLLVLAGTDRLDKPLTIGQMQGKFQMEVIPATGHHLHEDDPTRLAEILVEFWRRNDRVVTGVKKVGEL